MPKPDLTTVPVFYHKYVQLVADENLVEAFAANTEETVPLLRAVPEDRWNYRYAEGKWSITQLVQHVIDAERIFSYRALCIARKETVNLPGFDENNYALYSKADARTKASLVAEFEAVRKATEALFASFDADQLANIGTANQVSISVNAIGFVSVGHVKHHLRILQERYGA